MTDIEELTEELSEEIQSLEEYEQLMEAEDAYESDSEAQDLLVQIRQKENELRKAHQENEPHEEHEKLHEEMEKLQEDLNQLTVVKEYYEAAEAFQDRLDEEVNEHLDDVQFEVSF